MSDGAKINKAIAKAQKANPAAPLTRSTVNATVFLRLRGIFSAAFHHS